MSTTLATAPAGDIVNPLTLASVGATADNIVQAMVDQVVGQMASETARLVRQRAVRFAVLTVGLTRDEIDRQVAGAKTPIEAEIVRMYVTACRPDLVDQFRTVNPAAAQESIDAVVDGFLNERLARLPGESVKWEKPKAKKA